MTSSREIILKHAPSKRATIMSSKIETLSPAISLQRFFIKMAAVYGGPATGFMAFTFMVEGACALGVDAGALVAPVCVRAPISSAPNSTSNISPQPDTAPGAVCGAGSAAAGHVARVDTRTTQPTSTPVFGPHNSPLDNLGCTSVILIQPTETSSLPNTSPVSGSTRSLPCAEICHICPAFTPVPSPRFMVATPSVMARIFAGNNTSIIRLAIFADINPAKSTMAFSVRLAPFSLVTYSALRTKSELSTRKLVDSSNFPEVVLYILLTHSKVTMRLVASLPMPSNFAVCTLS